MIITKINLRIKETARVKAVASLCIEDRYWLNDIKLVLCNSGQLRAEFPRLDYERFFFVPVDETARQEIETQIIDKYLLMKETQQN